MALIKWRDSYATGIPEMDDEHREIIDIINTLYEMIRDKKNYEELKNVYERMYNYSLNHFSHEEQILEESNYSGLAAQKEQHSRFAARLEEMKEQLLSADESAIPEVYKFLREWWLQHIVEVDGQYGDVLKED
ncbi:MAG: bacteriohemerythrin [Desulfocapsaceae bacterium]|nr:bacteriohemerythrin [Desulfocapsaceae bacterium]